MTLDEAMRLAEANTVELSDKQLAEMNTVLQGEAAKENASDDIKIAAEVAVAEADARLEQLGRLDSYDIGDLDNIISLAGSVSGFSQNADLAKSILEKATQQKDSLTPEQLNEAALDGIINDSSYTEEEKELALEAAMQYNEELRTNAQNETPAAPEKPELTPQQLNEAALDEILNSDQYTDEEKEMALDAGIEYNKELDEKSNAQEAEYEVGADDVTGEVAEDVEEVEQTEEQEQQLQAGENIPEEQAALEAFDKEYGIDTMTEEQLNKNAEFMDKIDEQYDPFAKDEQGNLVHPEFQEEFAAFESMVVTDDNGEPLSEEEQAEAKESLKQTAMFEAGMLTRGCAKGDSLESQYKENLKNSLQKAVVSTHFAEEVKGKSLDKETIGKAFVQAATQEGGLKSTKTGIMAYAGVVNGEMTKLRDRLQNKFKEIPAVQKMSAKIAVFDKSMDDKYGKKWKVAKRIGNVIAKRAKGVAMYTAIGALAGPAAPYAMAALAVKSGVEAYNGLKKKAEKDGMTLGQYAKAHPVDVALSFATSGLAIAGSAMGFAPKVGLDNNVTQAVAPVLKTATRVLAVGPKAAKAAFHSVKAFAIKKGWAKGNVEEEMAAAKESWKETLDATIGIVAGGLMTAGMQEMQHNDAPEDTQSHIATPQMSPEEMAQTLEHMGLSPDMVNSMDPAAMERYIAMHPQDYQDAKTMMEDKDHDGKPDYMDVDHGEGWAKANETQLDRLMDVDARSVNEALGGEWRSSAELKDMMEKGEFTDDQLKAIHDLAVKEFDENGIIIDDDLKAYYENLAKEAAAKTQEEQLMTAHPGEEMPVKDQEPVYYTPEEPQMTPAEQKMYDAILNTIGKNEDMSNPEIRASVEGLARQQFEDAKAALAAGDTDRALGIIQGVHEQGEKGELETATKHEEGDSRRVVHAKDGLNETKEKLDAAKEALAQDPNNEKLQKEVAKLEKEFDKDSLKLDNREIRHERSDLKDEIKHDKEALKSYEKAAETIEKNVGMTSAEVDKQLAAAGIDINNLPKDIENLPDNVKNLIGIHNQYEQVDKYKEELNQRIADNEKAREDLKEQRHDNKDELRNVKKGNGLSDEAEERLAGQSDFTKSELGASLVGLHEEQQQSQMNDTPVPEDNSARLQAQQEVDKFLADEVAKGNMTAEEAKEMAPLLVEKAEAEHKAEQAKEEKAVEQSKEEKAPEKAPEQTQEKAEDKSAEDKIREAAAVKAARQGLSGEDKEAFIEKEIKQYQIDRESRIEQSSEKLADMIRKGDITREDALTIANNQADKETGKQLFEGIEKSLDHEPRIVESPIGKVSYTIGDDGVFKMSNDMNVYGGDKTDVAIHRELANDIGDHIYGKVDEHHRGIFGERTERVNETIANETRAYHAEALKMVHDDIQERLAKGESISGADKAMKNIDSQLSKMGLKFGKEGELTAINNQSDTPAFKRIVESKGR